MSWPQFQPDFARWIRKADRLQPRPPGGVLGVDDRIRSSSCGDAWALSVAAADGFLLTIAGSSAILVPLQRRLVQGTGTQAEVMRRRWDRGHLARTVIALTSLALLAVAAV